MIWGYLHDLGHLHIPCCGWFFLSHFEDLLPLSGAHMASLEVLLECGRGGGAAPLHLLQEAGSPISERFIGAQSSIFGILLDLTHFTSNVWYVYGEQLCILLYTYFFGWSSDLKVLKKWSWG